MKLRDIHSGGDGEGGGKNPAGSSPGNGQPQPQTGQSAPPITGLMLGVIVGCCAAVLLLIVIIIIVLQVRKRRKKFDLSLDEVSEDSLNSTRSAPTSRSSSPKPSKRFSCPEVSPQAVLVRSMTVGRIPDFTLPPERVQPRAPGEARPRAQSVTSLQYQGHLIGSLQPDLYSCSRSSSYSEDEESCLPPSSYGRLWFSIVYDAAVDQLHVTLHKVKDLPPREKSKSARDPFVKVFLLPDERTCHLSKVRRKTLCPVFNERFQFQVTPDDVKSRVLRFSVYDVDKRRVRHSLGHAMIPLKDVDLTKGERMHWELEPMAQAAASLGDLQFSLTYIPQTEKIKVVVIRGRNFRQLDYDPDSGVYVRISLYQGRKLFKSKRTAVQLGSVDPEFNESLSFSLSGRSLDSLSMVVAVMATGGRTRHVSELVYGKVTVGPFMFARGEELIHWQEMVAQPRTTVTRWHALASAASQE